MPSLGKYFVAAFAVGLGSVYYYTSIVLSLFFKCWKAAVVQVFGLASYCFYIFYEFVEYISFHIIRFIGHWLRDLYIVPLSILLLIVFWQSFFVPVMFSHNLRRLGHQVLNRFMQKAPRSVNSAGRLCLVLLPMRQFSLAKVQCLSAKSEKSSTSELSDMSADSDYKNAKSVYEFTVKDTYGNDVSLDKYKGQVLLIVNIASKCGLTKNNYKKITELKEKYYDKGLRVLSFPCNQFSSQMPEADGEEMVCHLRDSKADVGDVFQKVDVNGDNAHALYKFLKHRQTGTLGSAIKWNFTKFLVDKEGQPVNRYAPTTDPMDIAKDIEKLL